MYKFWKFWTNNSNLNNMANNGNTPLHIAEKLGNFKMVALLVQHGAKPEERNNHNYTPIDLAKQYETSSEGLISWDHVITLDILCEYVTFSILPNDHILLIG